jgi:hypothetical protein
MAIRIIAIPRTISSDVTLAGVFAAFAAWADCIVTEETGMSYPFVGWSVTVVVLVCKVFATSRGSSRSDPNMLLLQR